MVAMAPRKQKVLLSRGIGKWVVLTNDDWSEIEKQYKHKVPDGVRLRIALVTIWYTMLQPATTASPRIKTILPKVKRLQKVARSLAINITDPETGRPESDLRLILDLCFATPQQAVLAAPIVQFELLAHLVHMIDRLCAQIITTVSQPDYSGFENFQVWNLWVALVSLIADSANLPSKIRKDIDKQHINRHSQFVILIREIQSRLPEAVRRIISDESLAQAILRARNYIGFDCTSADVVDMLIMLFVGVFIPIKTAGGWVLKRNRNMRSGREIAEMLTNTRVRMKT
jgi:hypothetical protein